MKKKLIVTLFAIMVLSLVAVVVLTACNTHEHHYERGSDTTHHWKECKVDGCDEPIIEKEPHEDTTGNGKCDVCGDSVPVRVTGVSISPTSIEIRVNGGRKLTATVLPSNATNGQVTWTSSDEKIATVDQTGYVSGVGVGDAVITATADGVSATCNVNVDAALVQVESFTLDQTLVFITEGETVDLIPIITPTNATYKDVTWSSSDYTKARVNNGTVSGEAEGTVTITARHTDSGKTATCYVVVRPAVTADLKFTEIKEGDEVVAYSVAKYSSSTFGLPKIVIPSTYNGKPVTGIDSGAFKDDISKTVSVYIPTSVVDFGSNLFNTGTALNVYYYGDLAEWCAIPNLVGLGNIRSNSASNARKIYVTNKETGNYLYLNTAQSLTIPEGATSIGGFAFYWCISLTNIYVPASVESIASNAFYTGYDTNLNTVFYGGTAEDWAKIDSGSAKDFLDARVYFYSATQPATDGKFWYYKDGKPSIWA